MVMVVVVVVVVTVIVIVRGRDHGRGSWSAGPAMLMPHPSPVPVVRRGSAERMLGLEDRIRDQLKRVLVLEPVEHPRALLAGGHDVGKAQFRQMLGDGRRGLVDDVGQVVHRQLPVAQGQDDPHPGGVGEHREHLHSQFHVLAVLLTAVYLLICIHTQIIAQAARADQRAGWVGRLLDAARSGPTAAVTPRRAHRPAA